MRLHIVANNHEICLLQKGRSSTAGNKFLSSAWTKHWPSKLQLKQINVYAKERNKYISGHIVWSGKSLHQEALWKEEMVITSLRSCVAFFFPQRFNSWCINFALAHHSNQTTTLLQNTWLNMNRKKSTIYLFDLCVPTNQASECTWKL